MKLFNRNVQITSSLGAVLLYLLTQSKILKRPLWIPLMCYCAAGLVCLFYNPVTNAGLLQFSRLSFFSQRPPAQLFGKKQQKKTT